MKAYGAGLAGLRAASVAGAGQASLWRSVQGGGSFTYADKAHVLFGALKPHCDCSLGAFNE